MVWFASRVCSLHVKSNDVVRLDKIGNELTDSSRRPDLRLSWPPTNARHLHSLCLSPWFFHCLCLVLNCVGGSGAPRSLGRRGGRSCLCKVEGCSDDVRRQSNMEMARREARRSSHLQVVCNTHISLLKASSCFVPARHPGDQGPERQTAPPDWERINIPVLTVWLDNRIERVDP